MAEEAEDWRSADWGSSRQLAAAGEEGRDWAPLSTPGLKCDSRSLRGAARRGGAGGRGSVVYLKAERGGRREGRGDEGDREGGR